MHIPASRRVKLDGFTIQSIESIDQCEQWIT